MFAGTPGHGEWQGSVWGFHLAWSANHVIHAERLADGRRTIQLGELLHPGELTLAPGESYRTPDVIAVHADTGLTAATQQFHRHLRARPSHPSSPRPVLVNTWEAVYFQHDADTLRALADRAALVGVERFVLDDGWFGSRRSDRAGLGDWVVSDEAHPRGLDDLIDHVSGLGMDFGIWVEPEMVNPDSDVYRAHPDWTLTTDGYEPVLSRNQLVLDLGRDDAYEHVLGQLDALLRDHEIAYLKWDMNRDHIGGSGAAGAAGTHAQTLAVYRLLDELRRRHPTVEIESCSSGGGRIDHEILRRTQRVWASDTNDALERQTIQRGTSMLIPPEMMGSHIGDVRSHTTGRRHDLAFRAATALFGHLGIEWNLLALTEHELGQLTEVVMLHRRLRPLLHGGDVVRFDTEPAYLAHGVYALDRSEAVVAFAVMSTAPSLTPPPLLLPGLEPERRYRVERSDAAGRQPAATRPNRTSVVRPRRRHAHWRRTRHARDPTPGDASGDGRPDPPHHGVMSTGAIDRAIVTHGDRWGSPQLLTRAPARVNLIGEHTDYNDGFALPMALPFDTAIAMSDDGDRVSGTVTIESEGFGEVVIDPADNPRSVVRWARHLAGVIALLTREGVPAGGWRAAIATDIPVGAGLSSSAALEVAAITALLARVGSAWPAIEVARLGQRVENEVVGLSSGIMDQFICAGAVQGAASLMDCRALTLTPTPMPDGVLVAVLDTGTRRVLADGAYGDRRNSSAAPRPRWARVRCVTSDPSSSNCSPTRSTVDTRATSCPRTSAPFAPQTQ